MKLVSIPANPVPDDVVAGAIKTSDGVNLRFARWAPPPGRKGTVVVCRAVQSSSKNILRPFAICARADSRWRLSTGEGKGFPTAGCPIATKAMYEISANYILTSKR